MLVERIGMPAMLKQTAEECVELAHAAMKLERELEGVNKTHRSIDELAVDFEEEVADIMVCCDELGIDYNFLFEKATNTFYVNELHALRLIINDSIDASKCRKHMDIGSEVVALHFQSLFFNIIDASISLTQMSGLLCLADICGVYAYKKARMQARLERDESCGVCRWFDPDNDANTCQAPSCGGVNPKASSWCYDFRRYDFEREPEEKKGESKKCVEYGEQMTKGLQAGLYLNSRCDRCKHFAENGMCNERGLIDTTSMVCLNFKAYEKRKEEE